MSTYKRQRSSVTEEAQRWVEILKDASPADQAGFAVWIRRSPQHLQAYLQCLAIDAELQQLDGGREFDVEALLAKAATNVIQLTPTTLQLRVPVPEQRHARWRWLTVTAASGILALGLIYAGLSSRMGWTDYTTDTGEQRRIALPDGSSIELNTQSHIRVSMRRESREVELLAGEALFDVKHNANQPFRVRVGERIVEDLGTQFSVYLRPDASTTVSVLEGRVQILSDDPQPVSRAPSNAAAGAQPVPIPVSPQLSANPVSTRLSAGDEVHIAPGGRWMKHTAINIAEAAPWREHRLWFEGATLETVATEFNRYNKRQLHVGSDAALLKKRYTGTFDAYDPDSFVQALQDDPALLVQATAAGTLIQGR